MCEIADTIEHDIARALQSKPEKVYENYWTIYEKDSVGSYYSYKDYTSFASYEDTESFLLLGKKQSRQNKNMLIDDSLMIG